MKVQHALRAFTAKDRNDIEKVAENFPETEFYKTEDIITQLGIGEALITLLNEKGIPTQLVHTMLCPPASRMDVLTESEIAKIVSDSKIARKYNEETDEISAYEMLTQKLEAASQNAEEAEETKTTSKKAEKSTLETILSSSVTRQVGRTAASIITRGLLGVLGLGGRSTRRKSSWF